MSSSSIKPDEDDTERSDACASETMYLEDDFTTKAPSGCGTAVEKVFSLPELIKQILLHLDTRTLFNVQRISKVFLMISKWTPIQRNMFLLEDGSVDRGGPIKHLVNPLLLDKAIGLQECEFYFDGRLHAPSRPEGEHDLEILIKLHDLDRIRKEGSWRQTKLMSRPCNVCRICIVAEKDELAAGHQLLDCWYLDLRDGATLGEVVDAMIDVTKKAGNGPWLGSLDSRREELKAQKAKWLEL